MVQGKKLSKNKDSLKELVVDSFNSNFVPLLSVIYSGT